MRTAGCEFADVKSQVKSRGLEATLSRLAGEGVYLTSDEFRGKKDAVRGALSFCAGPADFMPPESGAGFVTETSGSGRAPLRVATSLASIETTVKILFFAAHDLTSSPYAVYDATPLASGGVREILSAAKMRLSTERWFAREWPHKSRLHARWNYMNSWLIVLAAKSVVPGVPFPESVDNQKPEPIVRWLAEKTRAGKIRCLRTVASNAVRGARARGLACGNRADLHRRAVDRGQAGIHPANRRPGRPALRLRGRGVIGYACADPAHPDDMHVVETRLAVVAHPVSTTVDGFSLRPLLFTGLQRHPRKILLNVQTGDFADLERRPYGCGLGEIGLTLHLRNLRSFEKFTTEGMNYHYLNIYELLEKTLPAEFGGGPGDYQLVEEEDGHGQTRLTLRVQPSLNGIDEGRLLARLRGTMARGRGGNRLMTELWKGAGVFRIARQAPHATLRGKVLPLHVSRKARET